MSAMPGFGMMMAANVSGDHQVSRSLRFNVADTPSLSRTPGGAGDRKTCRFRVRAKLGTLGAKRVLFSAGTASIDELYLDTNDKLKLAIGGTLVLASTRVFRDPTAWYEELGFDLDTTQAVAADRASLRCGGAAISSYSTDSRSSVTQNSDTNINNTVIQYVGRDNAGNYFSGFLAEPVLIDGIGALAGYSGDGVCVSPAGSVFGANGFYLKLDDNSDTTAATLGKDSGGSNNLTPTGFSVAAGPGNDSLTDVPTSYNDATGDRGNYPTMCGLNTTVPGTLTDGGMTHTSPGVVASTFAMSSAESGKWYAEATMISGAPIIGVQMPDTANMMADWPGQDALGDGGVGYYSATGNIYNFGVNQAYGATYVANDVIGIEVNRVGKTVEFFKNGVSQGVINITDTANSYWRFTDGDNVASVVAWNFGQRPFSRTPTAGFLSPCSLNFTDYDPARYVDAADYDGSASPQSFADQIFAPHLLITASAVAEKKIIFDNARNKGLDTTSTAAEATISGLTLDAAGFTVPANTVGVSTTGNEFQALLVREISGLFDIVTWTGDGAADRLLGHSAGGTPRLVIAKRTDAAGDWFVWHKEFTVVSSFTKLNGAGLAASFSNHPWGSATFSSTQFRVGHNATNSLNANGASYVAYIFTGATGTSRAYAWRGNSNANGPCNACGFKPSVVIYAGYEDAGDSTYLHPNLQQNPSGDAFFLNTATAKAAVRDIDFLSNGFKIRTTNAELNSSAQLYWFMAFGQQSGPDCRAQ